jgi:nickel/cobalt exporter
VKGFILRPRDFRYYSFLSIVILTATIYWTVPERQAHPHALPGTYSYLTVYSHDIQYRLIISGVDMCRLTGWGCEDLAAEDLPRLMLIRDQLEDKLARGIRISQEGGILPMRIVMMKALPIGFELLMELPCSKPLRSFTLHYTLLADQNEMFQSFFCISTSDDPSTWEQLDLLDKNHSEISWDISGRRQIHARGMTRELIFNLRTYVERDLTWPWLILGFGVAVLLGIGHAFTPGHGKSLMAAYLVGSHGHIRDAVVMGLTTTATHTFSVVLLGLVIMFFSQYVLPSTLYPLMARISAILIVITGLYVFYRRIVERVHHHPKAHKLVARHISDHIHDHNHLHHEHYHHKETTGQAFWLAFSGGLIPCPSALAVLLAGVSIGKVGYGIIMILVFSLGLGGALVLLGIGIITSRSLFSRLGKARIYSRHLDLVGPAFIVMVGILFLIHGPFGSLSLI